MHLTIQSPYISAALQQKLRVENGKCYKISLQCDLSLWITVVFLYTSSPLQQFLLFLTQKLVDISNRCYLPDWWRFGRSIQLFILWYVEECLAFSGCMLTSRLLDYTPSLSHCVLYLAWNKLSLFIWISAGRCLFWRRWFLWLERKAKTTS